MNVKMIYPLGIIHYRKIERFTQKKTGTILYLSFA